MSKGVRLTDTRFGDLPLELDSIPHGSYWKVLNRKNQTPLLATEIYSDHDMSGNLTGGVWGVITPNGLYGLLTLHTVREHDDQTISVRPGDGSSNSILISGGRDDLSWHGYIEHGEWTSL